MSDDEGPDLMDNNENEEEQLGITDHDEEISVGQTLAVKVKLQIISCLNTSLCQLVVYLHENKLIPIFPLRSTCMLSFQ